MRIAVFLLSQNSNQTSSFVSNLGKTTTEHMKGLNENDALSHTSVFDWFHIFREGNEDFDNDPMGEQPLI
jgi:hypothetical protein